MYCKNCGKEIDDNAVVCINCGCAIEKSLYGSKTFLATLLFCIFLGGFGAHRFYTGHIGSAIAQLLMTLSVILCPITGIWVLVDLILIISGNWTTKQSQKLV